MSRAWISPVGGRISSRWGRRDPIRLPSGAVTAPFHAGTDIAGPTGTPVVAPAAGTVIAAGPAGVGLTSGRSGLCVLIRHHDGSATYHGHLDELGVAVSQQVAPGQLIGLRGATGQVTAPHLHLEVRPLWTSTQTVDPEVWFAARGVTLGTNPPVSPAPPTTSPPPQRGEPMRLIRSPGRPEVWMTNGIQRVHVRNRAELVEARKLLKSLGLPEDELTLDPAYLASIPIAGTLSGQ